MKGIEIKNRDIPRAVLFQPHGNGFRIFVFTPCFDTKKGFRTSIIVLIFRFFKDTGGGAVAILFRGISS
uniref:Uncharacterized protein n=1 Tax=Anguilla anguilla TaxID=7936 RepID=A0A0E9S168_ANGAN